MRKLMLAIALLMGTTRLWGATGRPATVIIVAGQSNTDGRIPADEFDQYITPMQHCHWRWGSGDTERTHGGFELFTPADKSQRRFGKWAYDAFVYQFLEQLLGEDFYVVKWSQGGTAIDTLAQRSTSHNYWCADEGWLSRQKSTARGGHSLLLSFEELIGQAIDQQLSQLPKGYRIAAFLWHQGESDYQHGANYKKNLQQVVSHVRQYLVQKTGDECYARLPFIFGTVSECNRMFSREVKQGMQQLAAEDNDCHLIDVGKAELLSDKLHFTARSAEQLGTAIYNKMVELGSAGNLRERVTMKVTQKQLEHCPAGPYEATWESLQQNYHTPEWFKDAKFGIFIHWGVYSVPASGSEWYPKHMYNAMSREHRERWGHQREFGYKDFIPIFRAEKFDAREWAALFREAGARYVIPTAEHHDGFAMYDSRLTRWNAKRMGPRRDVIGELSQAVRAEGMKFGVSNHRIENWDFMYPLNMPTDSTDLFLPQYAGLYGPPQKPTEQSGMGPKAQAAAAAGATEAVINETALEGRHPQSDAFLNEWEMRVHELIDRYQPDLIYFDNGINYRSLDPWKLRLARYYYNSATHWGREVSIQSKSTAYLAGSILDFERESRAPKQTLDRYWQVDDPIGHKFGYVEGLRLQSADGIIRSLVDNISKNGNLCLNISPRSDGTIPDDQQQVLRTIGRWLQTYGEGVYGTRAYKTSCERNIRFTCRGDSVVYAFVMRWDGKPFALQTLNGLSIDSVTCLADNKDVAFSHTADGLLIEVTMDEVSAPVVGFKIKLKHRRRVLFIGDSITDGGWGRSGGSMKPSNERNLWDLNHLLGHGYVEMCAAHFQSTYPERDYEFLNRGISGNTLSDLRQRWQQDALDQHPDVVSILIGTNDADTFLRDTTQTAFDYEQWEQTYRQLIADLRTLNPRVRIILGTPFVAEVGKIGQAANYSERQAIVHRLSEIVKAIAADYQTTLVPYEELFMTLQTPSLRPDYWIWDGIHPTPAGHRRMVDLWIETVNEK